MAELATELVEKMWLFLIKFKAVSFFVVVVVGFCLSAVLCNLLSWQLFIAFFQALFVSTGIPH